MKTLRSSELLMSVPEENRNPDWIKGALQEAIEIEFSSVQFSSVRAEDSTERNNSGSSAEVCAVGVVRETAETCR